MSNTDTILRYPIVTIAQLCTAIGSGQLHPATSEGFYLVKMAELAQVHIVVEPRSVSEGSSLMPEDYEVARQLG